MQHVGTHLVTPAGLDIAGELLLLLGFLFVAQHQQSGLQHGHGSGTVLDLRALVLHGHHDAGRNVGDTHRGIRGVHALTARAGGAVGVNADFGIGHVDVIGRLNERHHFHCREAGLATALVVERGDTHQTVGAAFHAHATIRIRGIHLEGGGLDARLFGVGGVHDLGLIPIALRPTQVHAQQHLSEVGGIHTARAGADGHHCGTFVIFAVEQGLDFHVGQIVLNAFDFGLRFRQRVGVFFLLTQFHQRFDVVDALACGSETLQLGLHCRQFAGHFLRVFGIPVRPPELQDLWPARSVGRRQAPWKSTRIWRAPRRLPGKNQILPSFTPYISLCVLYILSWSLIRLSHNPQLLPRTHILVPILPSREPVSLRMGLQVRGGSYRTKGVKDLRR